MVYSSQVRLRNIFSTDTWLIYLSPGDWDPFPYVWPGLVAEPLTALNNRIYNPVCARLVGGGSTINAMNWIR